MKQVGIATGWIAGLILAGWFLFFFTQPIQNDFFAQNVNKILAQNGETRRLGAAAIARTPLGSWYPLENSEEQAFVFSIAHNGIFVPCIAFTRGKEVDVFPLNNHAKAVFQDIPQGVIDLHLKNIKKIEKK